MGIMMAVANSNKGMYYANRKLLNCVNIQGHCYMDRQLWHIFVSYSLCRWF